MSHLKTDWLCVATEGDTVDGREIKRQWIIDMGETYDYNHYVALIWPEHEDDCGNFGEVLEATARWRRWVGAAVCQPVSEYAPYLCQP